MQNEESNVLKLFSVTREQFDWLIMIKNHITTSLSIEMEDFGVNFRVNFCVKGKQLDRLVSILTRTIQKRPLKIPNISRDFGVSSRTVYEDINKLRK